MGKNVFRPTSFETRTANPSGASYRRSLGMAIWSKILCGQGHCPPPWCLCSATLGAPVFHTRPHVLQHCRRHAPFRNILTTDIPQLMEVDWGPEQLGAPNAVLRAFVDFPKQSGAFTKFDVPSKLNLILPPSTCALCVRH